MFELLMLDQPTSISIFKIFYKSNIREHLVKGTLGPLVFFVISCDPYTISNI